MSIDFVISIAGKTKSCVAIISVVYLVVIRNGSCIKDFFLFQ